MKPSSEIAGATSPEADIIRRIQSLIRTLAAGTATGNDRQELHDLQRRRVDLMRRKHFYGGEQ